VIAARAIAAPVGLAVMAGLAGCFSTPSRPPVSTTAPPELAAPPPMPDAAQDMVPRAEPRSRSGNPPFYDVLGKRYYVLSSSTGYWERGVASWYGPGFHKVRTSTGEIYDMYAMTAAHKTLPLPAYVRVTNLQNGRSIVVRVNDRGPYHDNRVIDVSVRAAKLLGFFDRGVAHVRVEYVGRAALSGSDDNELAESLRIDEPATSLVRVAASTPTAPLSRPSLMTAYAPTPEHGAAFKGRGLY